MPRKPPKFIRAALRRWAPRRRQYRFLRCARGVIHVGANAGQERKLYERHRLPVLWVEPIPEVYARLEENIRPYARQRALQALITDRDGTRHRLHIASNEGQSSSIFDLGLHRDIWPDIGYVGSVDLEGVTLPTALRKAGVDVSDYDTLVLDTQGSELLVLKGATDILPKFRFILVEAADFQAYAGACVLSEIKDFLRARGFREAKRYVSALHPEGGSYWDVLFRRKARFSWPIRWVSEADRDGRNAVTARAPVDRPGG